MSSTCAGLKTASSTADQPCTTPAYLTHVTWRIQGAKVWVNRIKMPSDSVDVSSTWVAYTGAGD